MSIWDSINAFFVDLGSFFKPKPKTKKVTVQAILEYTNGAEPISGQLEAFAYSLTGKNQWTNVGFVDTGTGGKALESMTLTIGQIYDFRATFSGAKGMGPSVGYKTGVLIT